jgi:protein arginine kinase activator
MKCDACQQEEAQIFLTQIVEGKMQKVNLCPACAKEKGVNDPTGFALTDLLMNLGSTQQVETNPGILKCTVCGFTQADFKKTGRLGCSHCYDVFRDSLNPMLKNMHKGIQHTGKVPARFRVAFENKRKLADLREQLDRAVRDEAFEQAASLRDQIRQLEVTS